MSLAAWRTGSCRTLADEARGEGRASKDAAHSSPFPCVCMYPAWPPAVPARVLPHSESPGLAGLLFVLGPGHQLSGRIPFSAKRTRPWGDGWRTQFESRMLRCAGLLSRRKPPGRASGQRSHDMLHCSPRWSVCMQRAWYTSQVRLLPGHRRIYCQWRQAILPCMASTGDHAGQCDPIFF